jgi:hypothetical protein
VQALAQAAIFGFCFQNVSTKQKKATAEGG